MNDNVATPFSRSCVVSDSIPSTYKPMFREPERGDTSRSTKDISTSTTPGLAGSKYRASHVDCAPFRKERCQSTTSISCWTAIELPRPNLSSFACDNGPFMLIELFTIIASSFGQIAEIWILWLNSTTAPSKDDEKSCSITPCSTLQTSDVGEQSTDLDHLLPLSVNVEDHISSMKCCWAF